MKQQCPPFGLRMPQDLRKWVKDKSRQQGRSMNNFVVRILEENRAAEDVASQK